MAYSSFHTFVSGFAMFFSCSDLRKVYPLTINKADPKAMMHIGTYQRARFARISEGTCPLKFSLISLLLGKEIIERIAPPKVKPHPLTALSAKDLAEKRLPSSLLRVSY